MTGYITFYSSAEINELELSQIATDFLKQAGIVRQGGNLGFAGTQLSPLDGLKYNITSGGTFYITNDTYADNGSNPKYWMGRFSGATETLTFAANSSGSTRIDLIAIKVDTTVTDANADNTGVASLVVVQGTPGAGVPATPANHIALYQVTIVNGETEITDTEVTDVRVEAVLNIPDSGINTAQIADSAVTTNKLNDGAVTYAKTDGKIWWEELGRTTLGSAADLITLSGLAGKKYLKILISVIPTGGTIRTTFYFNNDTGPNYSYRIMPDFSTPSTGTNATMISMDDGAAAVPRFAEIDVVNIATQEKLFKWQLVGQNTAGSGNAPSQGRYGMGKWVDTSNQITRIDVTNNGTGDYAIGSEVIVLGHN